MRSLFDIRFSRSALLLIAVVSGLATFVILHGAQGRTPAQLAALAALRDRPHRATSTTTGAASTPAAGQTTANSGGSGSGNGSGSSSLGGSGGGSSGGGSGATLPGTAVGSSGDSSPAASTPTTSTTSSPAAKKKTSDLPKVKHVFEIMLSAPSYAAAFGRRSVLTTLRSLIRKGTLLTGYRSLGEGELADELAAVSGQAPNHDTERGCPSYVDFPTSAVANKAGIVGGHGCVYPETALTIGDQVSATGARWGAYIADMGKETCVHPNSGAADDVLPTGAEPGYDTRHNPFIYFHSLLDLGDCANDDVDLTRLPRALAKPARTPRFAYLAPDACADGDPTMIATTTTTTTTSTTSEATTSPTSPPDTTPVSTTTAATTTAPTAPEGCPDGSPAGLAAENAFLKTWVPRILHSGAYRHAGALVIAFTRSGTAAGHPVRAGALILSPDAQRGTRIHAAETPYSLLRFDEDALGLDPLAHAKPAKGLASAVLKHTH